jgi:hypothetical protein
LLEEFLVTRSARIGILGVLHVNKWAIVYDPEMVHAIWVEGDITTVFLTYVS